MKHSQVRRFRLEVSSFKWGHETRNVKLETFVGETLYASRL